LVKIVKENPYSHANDAVQAAAPPIQPSDIMNELDKICEEDSELGKQCVLD
jgi:hypothetical protein